MINILVYPGWKSSKYYEELYKNIPHVSYAEYEGGIFNLTVNLLRHKQTDVIHLHWLSAYFAVDEKKWLRFWLRYIVSLLDLLLIKLVFRKKTVWTVHNLYEHQSIHKKSERFAKKITGMLADAIIVHGKSAIKIMCREFSAPASKIHVIHHGPFAPLYPSTGLSQTESRTRLNLPQGVVLYFFQGTDLEYKGLSNLIEAFVNWKPANAKLLVAGKIGKNNMALMQRLPDVFIGHNRYIPDNEMADYFNAADWVVIPYKRILTSATLITAMGFGKPVIVPSIGTLGDYLDSSGGIMYDPNQKDSLLSALEKSQLLQASTMGQHNLIMHKQFAWSEIQKQTLKVYSQITNK